jgi:hypothetical protein
MKMTRSLVILVSFLFVNAIVANAQKKVKYKDLIILLNAKQYDQAEPFLKRYIKDNNDNPNAYLFLGIIFQEKALKADVLKETELAIQYADSAVLNLEIANKTIDEREVRRNDEYYQVYNRRDLRTGEFGVTLSDVKLDIEKRLTLTKERKQNVRKLKDYFIQAEQQYISSVKRFQEIKQGLPENKFYLLSNEKTKESLHNFTLLYDSFTTAFDNYKAISKITIKTGYNQVLKFVPIKSYDTDGLGATDFMKDEVPVWNFKAWANSAADVIANDIEPMRIELTKTDLQLNLLGEKLKKDSVSVNKKIQDAISKFDVAKLKKYDNNPFPATIFDLKVAELQYGSVILENKIGRDSADVNFKFWLTQQELRKANRLDSLASSFLTRDIENEAMNYQDFVSKAYGDVSVIKKLAHALKEYGANEVDKKQRELEQRKFSLRWIISKADSIPLFSDSTVRKHQYRMLLAEKERFTVGLKFGSDSLAIGYFYTITPSRVPDVSATFSVDKINFKKKNFSVLKSLTKTDGKDQIYFVLIFSEAKVKDKYATSIAKIYRSDGLAWSFNYLLDSKPTELIFVQETGELSIKLVNDLGETKIGVIDKSGKLVKM